MGLKFSGRTPSQAAGQFGLRVITPRGVALRLAMAAGILCLLVAFARARLGDAMPSSHEPLRIFVIGTGTPNFHPRAQLEALPGRAGWLATVGAVGVFACEFAQQLGPRGWPRCLVLILLAGAVWLVLAHVRGWRKPSLLLIALVSLQLFGAAYYFSSFRAPTSRLQTLPAKNPYCAFDFHVHTTRSNGLLTPQQQIDWHRVRGFNGLAFTDTNRMIPDDELKALRAANSDMLLLNGCEYHGAAHLILLDLKAPISSDALAVPEAIQAAKRQNAIIIVAHPWYPAKYTTQQFLEMGVDGFEAWNGEIWSRDLALLAQQRGLIATTGTDTLSKSGARCFTWTLLPQGMDDPDDVLRALRRHKLAAAFTLGDSDTPTAYDERQARLRRFSGLVIAARESGQRLSRAQRLNTILGLLLFAALLWAWGAQVDSRATVPSGPNRALGFLRRRRLGLRLVGLLLMILAVAGSLYAALLTMGATFKAPDVAPTPTLTPLHAIIAWIVLDGLYLYGRSLWGRTH
ncbi:MAG: hypothetical protein M3347_09380 [Armatimonadota bacterium]|nr:hypothetical protein [Armatimonadota bacterium]